MTINTAPYTDVATMIQAQAAEVGMKIEILPLSFTTLEDYKRGRQDKDPSEFKAGIVRSGMKDSSLEWAARYILPTGSLNYSGYNQEGGYQNPEALKLIEEAVSLSDYIPEEQEKMKEIYKKVTPMVRADATWIDVAWLENVDILQNYVKGRGMLGVEHGRWIWAWLDK
jgi:ABC-type transport system substrate-binding protein